MYKKIILVTGSTDGIGKLTAEMLLEQGCKVILHGREQSRLQAVAPASSGVVGRYVANFAAPEEVQNLVRQLRLNHSVLDAVINNAGLFKACPTAKSGGIDVRFAVNTIAPYLLTHGVLPMVPTHGRIINVASAAQAPLDLERGFNVGPAEDFTVYAQSKLALVIWTQALAREIKEGPAIIAVNPGSLLASKIVREGLGLRGRSLSIGAKFLCEAVLSPQFADKTGAFFDNDKNAFVALNPETQNPAQVELVMNSLSALHHHTN
jgi:NAD(P)-dependent dehydrogenase (short-subunit alcohol dehydrogenase family)